MNTTLYILYIVLTFWAIIVIVYYGRRPTKSISWVFAVITLPFAGPLLYYLFGVNRRKFKFFSSKQLAKRKKFKELFSKGNSAYITAFDHTGKEGKIAKLIQNNSGFSPYSENDIAPLHDGKQTFDTLFHELGKAEKFIHVQYYLFEQGEILQRMLQLFEQKIKQGVKVRIIYDSFGSYAIRGGIKKKFQKIGASIYPIMPIRFGNLLFSLNFRNHRKIVVIDGKVAFTGGLNITDKYVKDTGALGQWKDVHLKLQGPIVQSLHRVFLKDYSFASQDELDISEFEIESTPKGSVSAQVVSGGPDSEQPIIMQQYIAMMNNAQKSVCITNPYFLPGEAFLQSLKIVALQGIAVTLLLPEESDSKAAMYAMFSQFEELLDVGVHIFLRPDFSHGKVLLIDEDIVSIGSGNFDNRSFEHNYETNVIIYDKSIAKGIGDEFYRICRNSRKLDLTHFKKRPRWKKFMERVFKFFKPLL